METYLRRVIDVHWHALLRLLRLLLALRWLLRENQVDPRKLCGRDFRLGKSGVRSERGPRPGRRSWDSGRGLRLGRGDLKSRSGRGSWRSGRDIRPGRGNLKSGRAFGLERGGLRSGRDIRWRRIGLESGRDLRPGGGGLRSVPFAIRFGYTLNDCK